MIDAFKQGGDFHSRTAVDMYDYIQKAIDKGNNYHQINTFLFKNKYKNEIICVINKGECQLEKGMISDDKPLVKEVYATERRKAKVLNFSIAYGKTSHGLSKDWKVSLSEAEDTLNRHIKYFK